MVHNVKLKWLSFSIDIENIDDMLENQIGTYAVLKHSKTIKSKEFEISLSILSCSPDDIKYKKLKQLALTWNNGKVGIVMDEEFVEEILIPTLYNNSKESNESQDEEYDEEIIFRI